MHVYIFQVMLAGAAQHEHFRRIPALAGRLDGHLAAHVLGGQAFRRSGINVGVVAREDHLAAVYARFRAHI